MREFTTEKVSPADAEAVVNIMESFGWQLIDSEEFYDEDTQVTGVEVTAYGDGLVGSFMKGFTGKDGNVKVNTYTKVINYTTLRFMRETEMPHHEELKGLQDDFMYYLGQMNYPEKPKKFTVVAVILAILSILIGASLFGNVGWLAILLPVAAVAICVLAIVLKWKSYKKREQYYYHVYGEAEAILERATSLLNE